MKTCILHSLVLSTMTATGVFAETVILEADRHSGKDNVWEKRASAGKPSWGLAGTHRTESGSMWFNSFPGETGTYRVQLGAVTETDGRPHYRVTAGGKELGSGRYPYACDGKLYCSENGPIPSHCGDRAIHIDLGEHSIEKGMKIVMWGQTDYPCSWDHGSYARWWEIRFVRQDPPTELDNTAPTVPGSLKATVSGTSIELSWSRSADAESGITEYRVYVNSVRMTATPSTSVAIRDLQTDTEYRLAVSAVNGAGLESTRSGELNVRTGADWGGSPVHLIAPNGGETYETGQTVTILFETDVTRVTDVDVLFSPDNGRGWIRLNSDKSINTGDPDWGAYRWTIPARLTGGDGVVSTATSTALIRVADYNDGTVEDHSGAVFRVLPPPTVLPGKLEAEDFIAMEGVQTESTSDVGGGMNVGWIGAGDWMDYEVTVESTGSYEFAYRVASSASTGRLELRVDGVVVHEVTIPKTGGWQSWATVTATAAIQAGKRRLRIVATGPDWNINYVEIAPQGPTSLVRGGTARGGMSAPADRARRAGKAGAARLWRVDGRRVGRLAQNDPGPAAGVLVHDRRNTGPRIEHRHGDERTIPR